MPGIVFCKRRCRFGSDDLFLPGVFLLIIHVAWVFIFVTISSILAFQTEGRWVVTLQEYVGGLVFIYCCCTIIESTVALISIRGSILNTKPRASMTILLYIRLVLLLTEVGWQMFGVVWIILNSSKSDLLVQGFIIGSVLSDWLVIMVVISVVSLSDVQQSQMIVMTTANNSSFDGLAEQETSRHRLCENNVQEVSSSAKTIKKSVRRYSAHRSACCFKRKTKANSFTDIAGVLSVFLRDLDLVPTDVIAGLILMHRRQKFHQSLIVSESSTEVYQFLSGAAITSSTRFLSLKTPETLHMYERVVHFMRYPVAAYDCQEPPAVCKRRQVKESTRARCSSACNDQASYHPRSVLAEDSSGCQCVMADLDRRISLSQFDLIYASHHLDSGGVDAIPFYVGLDHAQKAIVVCLWLRRLCLLDIFSEITPEVDVVPVNDPKQDWIVNKGLLQMAMFAYMRLTKDKVLVQALNFDLDKLSTNSYDLVLVGHSIAAGVATLLAIALRAEFPNLHCYAYSPPSGIIRDSCIEETKSFVTSVVVGKDLVPRIGLTQLDAFRQHLIEALASCHHSKWRIICGGSCCNCLADPLTPRDLGLAVQSIEGFLRRRTTADTQPTLHMPGELIHVIRSHPKTTSLGICSREEPVFQAIWAENYDFEEILVSPTMLSDHSPYVVFDALQKVLTHVSPAKPSRKPAKDRSCPMTPNTSSNVCEPSQADFQMRQLDTDAEPGGRAHAIVTLNPIHSLNWKNLSMPTDVCDFSISRERPKNFSMLPRQHLLEIRRDDLMGSAPLASPEVLSETSSLASFGSGAGSLRQSSGYQRLTSATGRMDPIKQSPLSQSIHTARGYCLMLKPPVDKNGGQMMGVNCITLSPLSDAQDVLDRSSDHVDHRKNDEASDREAEDDERGDEESRLIPQVVANCDIGKVSDEIDQFGGVGQNDVEVSTQSDGTSLEDVLTIDTCNLNSQEGAIAKALVGRVDGADLVNSSTTEILELEAKRRSCGASLLTDSDSDSVESSFGRQYLYDDYAGHYSPAGRGYPHGLNPLHGECQVPVTVPSLDGSSSYQSVLDGNDGESSVLPASGDESYGSCGAIEGTEGNGNNGVGLSIAVHPRFLFETDVRNNSLSS